MKHFCIMPWVHLHVGQTGSVLPCCQMQDKDGILFGNINEQSLEAIWSGQPIRDFRSAMMADQAISACEKCYHKEKAGLLSLRQVTNDVYAHHLDRVQDTQPNGSCPTAKPVYLDIRFSNLCNFRCRICGPSASSRWTEEAISLGDAPANSPKVAYTLKDPNDFFEQLRPLLPDLEELYFAGGEPLLMEEHYRLIRELEAIGKYDLTLRYSTNFSRTDHQGSSVFQLWKKFRKVVVNASLDDTGPRAELQRKEQNWERVLSNRKRMLQICPEVEFNLAVTLSVFNIWNLPGFHREWVRQGYIDDPTFLFPNVLIAPPWYNIRILPKKMKKALERKLREHLDWLTTFRGKVDPIRLGYVARELDHSIRYMLEEDWSHQLPLFREKCRILDELRGESTAGIIPELAPILEDPSIFRRIFGKRF